MQIHLKIEGRFKIIKKENSPTVIIDFAHTADAFENIFTHTRKFFPTTRIVAYLSCCRT